MKVYHNLDALPNIESSVLTIGTFDGVHLAHQQIIHRLIAEAHRYGVPSVLITFHPHPRSFVSSASQTPLHILTSISEKIEVLQGLGLDMMVILPFDRKFSECSPLVFAEDILIKTFKPKKIIIGYDHKFGKDRMGDIHLLRLLGESHHYEVEEITQVSLDEMNISSTSIRRLLTEGNVESAAQLLGRPYELNGLVVKGLGNGKKLGYPTANIAVDHDDKLIPRDGVYQVEVEVDGWRGLGALNIGNRPSIDQTLTHTVEVYILDFDKTIYGERIRVKFLKFLRPEMKFPSLDSLKDQIEKDVMVCRN